MWYTILGVSRSARPVYYYKCHHLLQSPLKKRGTSDPPLPPKYFQSWKHLPSLVCDCFISVSPLHTPLITLLERSFIALQPISGFICPGMDANSSLRACFKESRVSAAGPNLCLQTTHTVGREAPFVFRARQSSQRGASSSHLHSDCDFLSFIYFFQIFLILSPFSDHHS